MSPPTTAMTGPPATGPGPGRGWLAELDLPPSSREIVTDCLAVIDGLAPISRFASARKLASWAGLTPTVRGSDLTARHGHISKQGSAWQQSAFSPHGEQLL